MPIPKLLRFPSVVLLCSLVCRAQDPTAIRGNWHLAGSWDSHRETPHLTLSLGVIGNKILGMGGFAFSCPDHGPGLAITLMVEGQIAEDGKFLLLEPEVLESDWKITISGEIPKSGSEQWSGTYNFSRHSKGEECSAGADFVATKLPPLRGVYSGTVRLLDRSEVAIAVDLKQDELGTFQRPGGNADFQVPLEGTMTLSGSEKLPAKRLTADTSVSRMGGDGFFLLFRANNGKRLMLSGSYMDANSEELRVDLIDLDHPNVIGAGTLTRQ